jgi:thiamine-monophosphate kinase
VDEFDLIATYFSKASHRQDVKLSVGDDCAVLTPPPGFELIATMDALVEGSHFSATTHPFDIGYKALAVSLSDIAAMGGEPAWVLLGLTLPEADQSWLGAFSDGFYTLLNQFNLALVGGNVAKGPVTITTQVQGFAPKNTYLTRRGAKTGDLVYVTGNLGDGGLAWSVLQQQLYPDLFSDAEQEQLARKLWRPMPRITEGKILAGLASAAIDISDGLAADLGHVLDASGVGATIFIDQLPMSSLLTRLPKTVAANLALSAGDDYELCFTIPPDKVSELVMRQDSPDPWIPRTSRGTTEMGVLGKSGWQATCIGRIETTQGLRVMSEHGLVELSKKGYRHF